MYLLLFQTNVYTFVVKTSEKPKTIKKMKKLLALTAIALAPLGVMAQQSTGKLLASAPAATKWNLDKSHSSVKFTVQHLVISEVEGTFKMFAGNIESPAPDFTGSKIDFTVDVNSVDTDDEKR